MKILFTGGGTGGHLFPIIAIAREIKRLSDNPNIKLYYIGPNDKDSLILLSQENFKINTIVSGKIRRYFSGSRDSFASEINLATLFKNIVDILFKIPLGFFQSFFILLFIRPQLVFSKGGLGSLVVVFCAKILGIPIFLHESDTVPGLSNRVAYKWAEKVFISFPKTEYFDLTKTILVGNPILKEILEGNEKMAQEIFNLTFEKPILLFLGGSQGAQAINDFVLSILNDLLNGYEIIHVCGKKNYKQVQAESQAFLDKDLEKYYHLYEFLDEIELKHALKACSFVISRAGSGSIFEIAACGKPSILIPLPSSANNHQSKNAYEYSRSKATIIIEQESLNPNFFLAKINYLISSPKELEGMKNNALRFSKPLAAKAIAREILEYLNVN